MKILVIPNELSNLEDFKDSDGFIVGIKNLSWFMPLELSIKDLKEVVPIVKDSGKKIFVSLNKLMYNEDIPLLKEYLLVMDSLGIDGIMYDDVAIPSLSFKLNLKTPLVWFGVHALTNHYTANYWANKGVKYGVLSTEIPLDHIREIRNKTELSLMMYGYGYLPMFVSSRPLLTSYFKHIGDTKKDEIYHMYEEARNMAYPTYENEQGTVILSAEILNVVSELPEINEMVDYIVLSSLNIPTNKFIKVYKHYVDAMTYLDNKAKLNEISSKVNEDSPSKTDKGFMYKETVYRVKE